MEGSLVLDFGLVVLAVLVGRRVVDHMGKYLFGVVESLLHFLVAALEGSGKRVVAAFCLLVDVGEHLELRGEDDLGLVGEVDLHDLVGETEENGVAGLHPLLEVYQGSVGVVHHLFWLFLVQVLLVGLFLQVVLEVLQQGHLLVQFLRVVVQGVAAHHVLSFQFILHLLLLEILEEELLGVHDDLGRVVEEHPAAPIGQHVAQSIFGRVVNELPNTNLSLLLGQGAFLAAGGVGVGRGEAFGGEGIVVAALGGEVVEILGGGERLVAALLRRLLASPPTVICMYQVGLGIQP